MTSKLKDLQGDHVLSCDVAGQATAGTADEWTIGQVPFRATVTAVAFIPNAAITGAATNFFTANVRNRGAAGAGSTAVALRAYSNGNNAAAFVADALTLQAGVDVAEGDILTLEKLISGTGLAMPDGTVVVKLKAR